MASLADSSLVRCDLPAAPLGLLVPRRRMWRQCRSQTRRQHVDNGAPVGLIDVAVRDVVVNVLVVPPVAVG
eukprot:89086-Pyramimonas_sp.AAC.1